MHESVSVHWVGVACVNTSLCIFDMLTVVVTLSAPFSMPLPRLREIRSLCYGLQSSYILSNSSSFSHPVFCVLRADENHWGGVEGCFLLLKNDSTKLNTLNLKKFRKGHYISFLHTHSFSYRASHITHLLHWCFSSVLLSLLSITFQLFFPPRCSSLTLFTSSFFLTL